MKQFECDAVLFDLDGVLVDSALSVERAWQQWATRHGLDAAQVLKVAHGHRAIETVALVAPHLDAVAETKVLEQVEIRDAASVLRMDGADELLAALPGDRWAVVTSGTRALAIARLRQAGLPIPEAFVTAESVVNGKPNPECYLKGAKLLGIRSSRCVVIEDAPSGVHAARFAGMMVIAVTTTHPALELSLADAVVQTIRDVRVANMDDSDARKRHLELLVGS